MTCVQLVSSATMRTGPPAGGTVPLSSVSRAWVAGTSLKISASGSDPAPAARWLDDRRTAAP